MAGVVEPELVVTVSREVVTQLAPEELPLFDGISEAHLADPGRGGSRHGDGDDVLGFGAGEAQVLLTPVALVVVTEVAKHVAVGLSDAGGRSLRRLLGRRRPEAAPAPAPGPLTPEQLAEVRRAAARKAVELGLDRERSALLADAIVGRLAARRSR
jgi:hypothetical protein